MITPSLVTLLTSSWTHSLVIFTGSLQLKEIISRCFPWKVPFSKKLIASNPSSSVASSTKNSTSSFLTSFPCRRLCYNVLRSTMLCNIRSLTSSPINGWFFNFCAKVGTKKYGIITYTYAKTEKSPKTFTILANANDIVQVNNHTQVLI